MASQTGTGDAKALVEAHYQAAINEQDLDQVETQLAPDFLDHGMPPGTPRGPGPVKEWLTQLKQAFPDLTVHSDDIIAEGNRVAVRATWRGTHRGEFLGIEPTGRQITFSGAVFWRLEGQHLAERWSFIDRASLMEELRRGSDKES